MASFPWWLKSTNKKYIDEKGAWHQEFKINKFYLIILYIKCIPLIIMNYLKK